MYTTVISYITILQGIRILFLVVYTTVHGYVQPYRDLLANLLEIAVNVNFFILLLMNTTPYFYDDLFIFAPYTENTEYDGIHNNIAQVSWILMPVYYLPLLGACITITLVISITFRYWLHTY